MRISHLSAEVTPFAKSGGLGDVAGALPKAQAELGHDVAVWMPLYREVWEAMRKRGGEPEVACEPFSVGAQQVGILRTKLPDSEVPLFLIGADEYFNRPHLYSSAATGEDDGIVRYALFVRAAMAAMHRLWNAPEILHAHDWHAALAPMAVAWDRPRDWICIVNGIDPLVWNPAVDPKIEVHYDASTVTRKLENRRALLASCGMNPDERGMVVGIIGRLTHQKGFDLLFPVLGDLVGAGIRFVMLSSGERELERQMHRYSNISGGRFWGFVGFQDDLAHRIEAGADAFLMPSRFEPCGLNQLYSLAYGTPPIVRRVGGLADTVVPYDGTNRENATGFAFDAATPQALRDTVLWAQRCYHDPALWTQLALNGMRQDFSWKHSAELYVGVYNAVRRGKGVGTNLP